MTIGAILLDTHFGMRGIWKLSSRTSIYRESFLVGVGTNYRLAWLLTGLQAAATTSRASVAPKDA